MFVLGLSFHSGCCSLRPFAKNTQKRIASARQLNNGGLEAHQKGRLDQAEGLFSRAVEQSPDDFRVRANLARTLFQSGDIQAGILNMQQAVDLSGGDPKLAIELGEMYVRSGQWLPARRQVQLALESNRRYAPAWVLSGKTEKAKGNYEKALADFHKALGYAPDLPGVQMQIVDTYQKMNQPLRALSAVEQVLIQHPDDEQSEEAIIAKSVVLMDLRQLSTAIDLLQTACQNEKASSQMFVRLSLAQIKANQIGDARQTIERGRQAFPQETIFVQMAANLASEKQRMVLANPQDSTRRY